MNDQKADVASKTKAIAAGRKVHRWSLPSLTNQSIKRKFMFQAKTGQPIPKEIKAAMQQVRNCQMMSVANYMAVNNLAIMPHNLSKENRQTLTALLKKTVN
ncbi:MAG: hypothetical protein IPH35_18200 [Rhodoferax sp.]|nr:hypothetical protein [Rhodoferax sp.]